MTKAKLTEQNTIQFPTAEDYTDGELTYPEQWKEYVESEKPQDTVLHKYTERFELVSDTFGGEYRIVQCWDMQVIEVVGRVAKLSGNELVFPQRNETLSDGTLICNANMLPKSSLMGMGFYLVEDTPYPQDGKTYREVGILVDDPDYGKKIRVVWEFVAPVPEPAFNISKLKLKREMTSIGKWGDFLQALRADTSAFEDFNLAVTLMSDDPIVIQFKGVCQQLFGLSQEQIDGMLKSCKAE